MNKAGSWHYCANCQSQNSYEAQDQELVCEHCHLTKEQAAAVEESRPLHIKYKPSFLTSGALMELSYSADINRLPNTLSILWHPNRGQTTLRLFAEDLSNYENVFSFLIDIPDGATSAKIIDAQRRSRILIIAIDYESRPIRKFSKFFLKIFGIR